MNNNFLKESLIAHRGKLNDSVVENTLVAFSKCIDNNYIIELDIQILKDDTIIVYHDYNMKRLCGVNKIISNLSYEQLSKYKVEKKYSIPTLRQVMHIVDGKAPLLIDIKDFDNNDKFEKKLSKILDDYKGDFAIMSFNPYVIEWFNKKKKKYLKGLIIYNKLNYRLTKKVSRKVNFICVNKKELPIKSNKFVIGWTIKTKEELLYYQNVCNNLICEKIL